MTAPKSRQLGPGDDGSRLVDGDTAFQAWPGDPFAGQPRKQGQIDYECNACGRTGRHQFFPDIPLGWWFLHDVQNDTVHLACKPSCAAKISQVALPDDQRESVRELLRLGWKYRSREKQDKNEAKNLSGGWSGGTL